MTHDDVARVVFDVLRLARARGIHDPLRQAHAVAAAIKLAEIEHHERAHDRPHKPIAHGTEAGYYAHHRRHDIPPCIPCRDARNEADRNRKRTA